jgi:hypothetical protein
VRWSRVHTDMRCAAVCVLDDLTMTYAVFRLGMPRSILANRTLPTKPVVPVMSTSRPLNAWTLEIRVSTDVAALAAILICSANDNAPKSTACLRPDGGSIAGRVCGKHIRDSAAMV